MPLPTAAIDPTCQWVPDLDQAATVALQNALQQSQKYETGGALYRNTEGQYCYSTPVGGTKPGEIQYKVSVPDGATLAGIYHTHPGMMEDSQTFSPNDVNTANHLKLASYILAMKQGDIRRYDPGVSKTHQMTRGDGQVSEGTKISNIHELAKALMAAKSNQ